MRKLFIAQFVLLIILVCAWGMIDKRAISSVLYGGAACILPNLYFAYRFFSLKHSTQRPGQILLSFYLGELMKMIVSALIIVVAVMYGHADLLPAVISYFVTNSAFWFAPTLMLRQQARSTP